jgi:diguanylate cyclase
MTKPSPQSEQPAQTQETSAPPPGPSETVSAESGVLGPITLEEAEALVRRLMPALQSHGEWVTRVHSTLICRTPPPPEDLGTDSEQTSELGRWFADEAARRRYPEYRRAFEMWMEQHARARELCQAVASGRAITPEEYRAFVDSIRRFDDCMEMLVRELWDLLLHTDPLTGITTRSGMLPRLRAAQEVSRYAGRVSSVCMIDLDHFKRINDAYGHAAGDKVLAAVSAFLASNLRHNDHICRYGGEEFVLLLPNTEPTQALELVDRLRRHLAELPITLDDGTVLHVTASFGIAPLQPDRSVLEAIAMADQAMYAAKRAGRNQVRLWQGA